MSSAGIHASSARSLYRRFLRELPSRSPSFLSNPSRIQKHVRAEFMSPTAASSTNATLASAEQYIQYLKAQRLYITLVERYNPGVNMDDEERVRLTARRVGMDLPDDWRQSNKGGSGNS